MVLHRLFVRYPLSDFFGAADKKCPRELSDFGRSLVSYMYFDWFVDVTSYVGQFWEHHQILELSTLIYETMGGVLNLQLRQYTKDFDSSLKIDEATALDASTEYLDSAAKCSYCGYR